MSKPKQIEIYCKECKTRRKTQSREIKKHIELHAYFWEYCKKCQRETTWYKVTELEK